MTKKEEKCLMESLEQDVQNSNKHKIDWEQRRYEIAKEYYCGRFGSTVTTFNEDARRAVECADILIAELKKKK